MYNKNYLSNRPFLIVNNTFKPPRGAQTQKKGWAKETGWEVHETIVVVDRVSSRHLRDAAAIIDVLEAKVVSNNFTDTSRENVLQYYMNKYKAQITEAIGIWMERKAQEKALSELGAKSVAEALEEVKAEVKAELLEDTSTATAE